MVQSLTHPEERTPHPADSSDPSHHRHGSMDVSMQEATFHRFMTLATRVAIAVVVLLVVLALVNG